MNIGGYGDGFGDYVGGGHGNGYMRIHGNGMLGYHDGSGIGNGNYFDKGNCFNKCNSSTNSRALYVVHPYAYLTSFGAPEPDTFDNYMFHLQVEPLVHRRV